MIRGFLVLLSVKCLYLLSTFRLRHYLVGRFYAGPNLTQAFLPLLKKYVMLFEMKAPIVHQLHEKQIETFKEFLVCFCKPEIIKPLTAKQLKALELPGLWNGAMSNWITLLCEVPLITFNPVKTINDLLRPEHQPKT